jgi:peptidoglycan/xylan/chitin deacetylase (PgdA/CDA1 family)
MKLDKRGSLRYRRIKKLVFVKKIVRNIAIGTIAISVALWINNYNVKDIDKIESNSTNVEQDIKFDNSFPSSTNNQELNTIPINKEDKKSIVEVVTIVEEKSLEEISSSVPEPIEENNIIPPIEEEVIIPVDKESTSPSITVESEKEDKKMVALSFDDGPSKTLTPELLKILNDNNCTATFFVLGNKVQQYSDIIYEVYSAGNEIGNHSYDHSNFANLTNEEIKNQLSTTNEAVYEVTNEYPTFFRPPYGSTTEKVKEAVNCPLALWSIDSNDWRKISDEEVINNVISSLEDGKIILMHDIHKRTIEVCKILIPQIKELGYDIVSIKELYEAKNIELEDGCVYSKAKKN